MVQIYKYEKPLFVISLVLSLIAWFALIGFTFGAALLYILFFFIFYLFAQSAFISYLKGTAVEITPSQMPDLHQRIAQCAAKVGLKEVPKGYLLNGQGLLNALATRFLGKHYLVLFSDVVDALDERPGALNFYIGHELGHIRRKHLEWGPLLWPAGMMPLLGAGYARAQEYTCDNYGQSCCDQPADATFGLAVLAAGPRKWATLDKTQYAAQAASTRGFWMSFHELVSDYPWLVKRMERMNAGVNQAKPNVRSRHPLAWLLAIFVPRLGFGEGGGLVGVMVFVAMIGILAAIAIPSYQGYMEAAKARPAFQEADQIRDRLSAYIEKHEAFPSSPKDIEVPEDYRTDHIESMRFTETPSVEFVLSGGKDTIEYTPFMRDGALQWDCSGGTLNEKARPENCR